MPESLPIAVAIVVAVVAGWDTLRHYMQLANGRLMAADKQLAFERELTAQSTRIAKVADNVAHDREQHGLLATRIAGFGGQISDLQNVANIEVNARLGWQAKAEATFEKLSADIDKRDAAITNVAEEVKKLIERDTMRQALAAAPRHKLGAMP
jgi:hypothetical protein